MFRLSFSLKSFGFSILDDFLPSLYINNSSTKREVKSELLITIQQLRKCGPSGTMGAFLITQLVKKSTCNAGDPGQFLGPEDTLEKEMATHSSILAWKIPWTEEPGALQSMGSKELDRT